MLALVLFLTPPCQSLPLQWQARLIRHLRGPVHPHFTSSVSLQPVCDVTMLYDFHVIYSYDYQSLY